jgi:hypothetical protein
MTPESLATSTAVHLIRSPHLSRTPLLPFRQARRVCLLRKRKTWGGEGRATPAPMEGRDEPEHMSTLLTGPHTTRHPASNHTRRHRDPVLGTVQNPRPVPPTCRCPQRAFCRLLCLVWFLLQSVQSCFSTCTVRQLLAALGQS